MTMAVSTAFCVFCFILFAALATVSGVVLFTPVKEAGDDAAVPATAAAASAPVSPPKAEDKDHIPEESVNTEDPVQPVVPNADVVREVGSAIIA